MALTRYLFLRDDDAAAATPEFLRLFNFLKEEKLPSVYAVIPALAEPALVRRLKGRGAGRLFETAQHGLRHKDHAGNRFMRQEFGPARTYARQLADIKAGAALMRRKFGKFFAPVFVPPFHTYNSDTALAAAAAGLKALSASKFNPALRGAGLKFLGTEVAVNSYGLDLRPRPLDPARLKAATLAALRAPGLTLGVYFHHDHLGEDFGAFRDYIRFLKDLCAKGLLQPALFSKLLKLKNI
ncbi:MAG: polysaccharide deacetylase family protein [Elusimicrobiales bacterium]|nr:polysaccharide deacetylase family protein [Elusimicrobiales bacterium]